MISGTLCRSGQGRINYDDSTLKMLGLANRLEEWSMNTEHNEQQELDHLQARYEAEREAAVSASEAEARAALTAAGTKIKTALAKQPSSTGDESPEED